MIEVRAALDDLNLHSEAAMVDLAMHRFREKLDRGDGGLSRGRGLKDSESSPAAL